MKLESEFFVTKQVNSFLSSRLVNVERQYYANVQYSRQERLDIVGIPKEVGTDLLEEKVVNILEKLGCNIPTNHIEAHYRVSNKGATVIVKFSCKKKDCQQVLPVKSIYGK